VRGSSTDHLRTADSDGLKITPIGRWALDKYRLVSLYCRLFSTGMKDKWPNRVYLELCAGSGFSQIDGTNQVYWGSPLLALGFPIRSACTYFVNGMPIH
jgi:hypothetical protein